MAEEKISADKNSDTKEKASADKNSDTKEKTSAVKKSDTKNVKNTKKENIHSGHRQRMLAKLNADNLDLLSSHEILEMLLYSVNKQKNTNPLAHALIKKFGSLSQVMKASEKELLSVDGIGNASVQLIRSVRAVVDRVNKENIKVGQTLRDPEKIKKFCQGLFKTVDREEIRILFLNNDFKYLSQELLGIGGTNSVFVDTFTLLRKVAEKRCTIVIITHNHPRGSELPSNEDKYLTRNLFNVLDKSGVYLADHVIVGMGGAFSMAQSNTLPEMWRGYS